MGEVDAFLQGWAHIISIDSLFLCILSQLMLLIRAASNCAVELTQVLFLYLTLSLKMWPDVHWKAIIMIDFVHFLYKQAMIEL